MKILLAGIVSLFLPLSVFAADAPEHLSVKDVSDTSITLDWDDAGDAMGYYIYYGTKTASGGKYEKEGVDLIEKSEFALESLIPETKYYIALTSVDEFGNESEFSDEIEYSTLKIGQKNVADALRIMEVKVKDASTLEFLFSIDLNADATAPLDFRVEELATGKEIEIDIAEVDSTNTKNIIAILSAALKENTKYKLTVLDVQDTDGKTIEAGINAFLNFTTPQDFNLKVVTPVSSVENTSPGNVEDTPDLNAAPEEAITKADITETKQVGNNAGVTLSSANMSGSVVQTAQQSTKLPQTGPAEWILILISSLFAAGIYAVRQKNMQF